jgi:putative ATPase
MDLFQHSMNDRMKATAPLAARMRPRNLDEMIGQQHIVGEGRLLRRAIAAVLVNFIIWPPGDG